MRTPATTLTPQELAIMKVVWSMKRATVRQVYETLREKRAIAYTTVMTMMKILEDKGYLKKAMVDRAHVYQPVKPRQQVIGAMVRDFLDRVFDGLRRIGWSGYVTVHQALMPGQDVREEAARGITALRPYLG